MALDGDGIIRAASQLDVAVQLGTAARGVDVPLALGRGAAKQRITDMLAETAVWSRQADAELEGAPTGLADVRRGIAALAEQAESAHASRPWKARNDSGFVDALEGARHTRARMSELVDGAVAAESGAGPAWLLESTTPAASAARIDAARDLTRLGELPHVGPAEPFVLRMRADDTRSVSLANIALDRGHVEAGNKLLDDLQQLVANRQAVRRDDLRIGFEAIGRWDDAPTWIARGGDLQTMGPVEAESIRLVRDHADASAVAVRLRELLDLADPSTSDLNRIGAIAELPPSMTSAIDDGLLTNARQVFDELARGQDPRTRVLEMWRDDVATREGGIPAAVDAVLADRSGMDGLRRMHTLGLDALEHGRPFWARDVNERIASITLDIDANVVLDSLRAMRRGITVEQAAERAVELARRADIDAAGTRELASLSLLPADLRPAVVDDVDGLVQAARGEATDVLDDVRWKADEQWMRADPEQGRAFADSELRRIAALENREVTAHELRRLGRLSDLPPELRPNMPSGGDYSFAQVAEWGYDGSSSYAASGLRDLRRSIAHADIDADAAITAETLRDEVRTILAKETPDVTIDDIRRLGIIESLGGAKAVNLPDPRSYGFTTISEYGWGAGESTVQNEFEHLRTWLARGDIERDPAVTAQALREEVRAILTKPDAEVTADEVRRLALLEGVTGEKALHLPDSRSYSFSTITDYGWSASESYVTKELDQLRTWLARGDIERDPALTAQSLHDEVRAILTKPDTEITTDDLRRLALLEGITGEKALQLPDPRSYSFSTIRDYGWGPTESYVTSELGHLRTWLERGDIVRDPTITAQTLHDEVRAVLAKPDAEVTADELRRIALLEGITGEKALQLPDPRSYSFSSIAEYGWAPTESYVTRELDQLRTWLARGDIARDPAITARTLREEVRSILAKPDADVTADELRRIALLEGVTGGKALHLPDHRAYSFATISEHGYSATDTYVARELAHLRTWLARGDIERDASITAEQLREEVRAILAKPDAEVTADDMRRLALLEGVRGDKALHLPDARSYDLSSIADNAWSGSSSYAQTELRNLRTWLERGDIARDPAITAQSLHDEVRAILAKPDADVTADDMRRLALLDGVTGEKALHLPDARSYELSSIADNAWSGTTSYAQTELRNLRTWLARGDIERDASITADTLVDEVRTIARKPDAEITAADLDRIGVLEGVTGAKALQLPEPRQYAFESMHGYGWTGTSSYVTPELRRVRTWLDGIDIARDPTVTAEALRSEAANVATLPVSELTTEHLRRLHVLSVITGPKSPAVPAPSAYSWEQLAEYGPSTAHQYMAPLREWAFVHTDEGLAVLAHRISTDQTIEPGMLSAAMSRRDALAELGVDTSKFVERVTGALRGKAGAQDQTSELEAARQLLSTMSVPAELQPLKDETLALAQRNLDRMAGRLHDGYSTYPDLAEVGRVIENTELLGRVEAAMPTPAPVAPAPAANATTDAAQAAEQLSW